jgi:DNA polymerase-3 subunit alpha
LLAILPRAIQGGQAKQDDRRRGQRGLFDDLEEALGTGSQVNGNGQGQGLDPDGGHLPDVPELADADLLGGEKKALGFYMSSHPLTRHAALLQTLATHRASELAGLPDKTEVILGGMIANVQIRNVQKSRSGLTRMAKLTFEDLTGSTPAMLWPEEYAKLGDLVKNDLIGFVKGTLDRRREPAELIVSKIMPIETAAAELARGVVVRLHKGVHQEADLERLLRFVRVRPGHLDLYLEILGIEHVRRAIYKAGASLRIRFNEQLTAEMEDVVGIGNVRLLGQRGATTRIESAAQTTDFAQASLTSSSDRDIDSISADEMEED